jgi:radical SAM superfamily enzyme
VLLSNMAKNESLTNRGKSANCTAKCTHTSNTQHIKTVFHCVKPPPPCLQHVCEDETRNECVAVHIKGVHPLHVLVHTAGNNKCAAIMMATESATRTALTCAGAPELSDDGYIHTKGRMQ